MKNPQSISARLSHQPVILPPTRRHRIARLFTILVPLLLISATIIRFTARDDNDASAPLFYAMPWPVIAGGWLVWLAALGFRKRWLAPGIVGFLLAAGAFFLEVKGAPPTSPPAQAVGAPVKTVKLLFWNLGHETDFPEALHKLIEEKRPDLLALVEFPKPSNATLEAFARRHPGLRTQTLPGDTLIAARGELTVEKVVSMPRRTRLNVCTVRFDGDTLPWTVGVADLGPWPLSPRTTLIREISDHVFGAPRTVVLGDFNTPFESVAFDPWRNHAWHGLANAPNAPRLETWPYGVPLLSIDHIWMSRDVLPRHGETGVSLPRDHSWLFCTVSIPE